MDETPSHDSPARGTTSGAAYFPRDPIKAAEAPRITPEREELVRQDMKLISVEKLPPTDAWAKRSAILLAFIAVIGVLAVVAAGAKLGGWQGVLLVIGLVLTAALGLAGLPRLLADSSRQKEHLEAERDINSGAEPRRL
ncbi:MAG: hypothetical protein H7Y88_05785 [Phycisphaerales bacterium]|nr:hypothetical protein [Phycisphaerales bacterium]